MKQRRFRMAFWLWLGMILVPPGNSAWSQERGGAVAPRVEETPAVENVPAGEPEVSADQDRPAAEEPATGEPRSGDVLSITPDESTPSEASETEPAAPAETIRYTVKEGDTLWDITNSLWQDPFLWPKVWRNNAFIFNPDLIYPGNIILFPADLPGLVEEAMIPEELPPPAEEVAVPEEEPAPAMEEVPEPELFETPEPAPAPAPEPKKKKAPDFAALVSGGFVLAGHEGRGKVISGADGRELLGENDIAYIAPVAGYEMSLGDRLLLSRIVRKVYHPKSKNYVGDLVHVLGVAEVIDADDKVKIAKILDSFDYISPNDLAVPYQDLESSVTASGGASGEPAEKGFIIDVKYATVMTADPSIVYLDRGLRDGIEKGARMVVIRRGEKAPTHEELPERVIGRLEVLMALDMTSTARVIQSTEPIERGDGYEPAESP